MELSSSLSGDHKWKIPVQTGLIRREHVKEKWWVTGAIILIVGQLAFGAAAIWFL
jgi:hypothetical protein